MIESSKSDKAVPTLTYGMVGGGQGRLSAMSTAKPSDLIVKPNWQPAVSHGIIKTPSIRARRSMLPKIVCINPIRTWRKLRANGMIRSILW